MTASDVPGTISEAAGSNDLRSILDLLPFLPPSSIDGEAAARAVENLVRRATAEAIADFDAWYREHPYWGPPRPSWNEMRLGSIEAWVRAFPATVAVATCHGNGFIREKAVRALSETNEGFELPFLLLRLNDWVPQVRFVAMRAVEARLTIPHVPHWIRALGVLERAFAGRRSDHAWLRGPVNALLADEASRGALEDGLARGSLGVRRACLGVALTLKEPGRFLHLALHDPDPVTSGRASVALCATLEGAPLRDVLAVLRRGNARARCLALETTCRRFPADARSALLAGLVDRTTSVRELARFLWTKTGHPNLDFAQFYRDELRVAKGEPFAAALRGIAETGSIQDVPIFLAHVDHPNARVREASILGIGRCDGARHTDIFTAALADPNLRVAKAAYRYARLYLGRGAVSRCRRF